MSSSNGRYFVRTLHYDLFVLDGPTQHGSYSFIEFHKPLHLDKGVIHKEDFLHRVLIIFPSLLHSAPWKPLLVLCELFCYIHFFLPFF